jgi:sugar phosphate isomerase/epimerase
MQFTRRDLGKLALAAVPVSGLLAAKPDSKFDGVQIGVITYSYRSMPGANDARELLKYIVDSGVSGIELMGPAAEIYAGAPKGGAAELKKWRLSASMDKYKELRKMYNDAGVRIYAFKLEPKPDMSDEEYEYIFHVADTLGASHVTLELPKNTEFTKRLGDFAAKKHMLAAYHAHTQATLTAWDAVLDQSKGNAINLDCGHYVAGTSESPVPLIRKHHDRIASMHLKDRKKASNGGANLPWGQGETPIREILQLMRQEKYKFPASIELEYEVPTGSDAVAEVSKCVQFCKSALA